MLLVIIDFEYSIFDVNNKYTKEDLIRNKNITSAILKAIALFFANLTDKDMLVLKHWIGNTTEPKLGEVAKKILDSPH